MFEQIIGNDQIKASLTHAIKSQTLPQSMLFVGLEGIGKSLFAEEVAKSLPGGADLHVYRPEGKIGMHSIASMREFSESVYMAPFQGAWKVFIIHDAERMLSYSANALLKTFEEPATDSIIILLSSNSAALLPTILSRCRTVRFQNLKTEEIAAFLEKQRDQKPEQAHYLANIAQGSLGRAIRILEQGGEKTREMVLAIMSQGKMASWKQLSQVAQQISAKVEESKNLLEEQVKTELYQAPQENLTALQKENIQKEVDGFLAMRQFDEACALFEMIYGWYRDLELLKVNGNRTWLMHRDYEEALEQALQRGVALPLGHVQKIIEDVRLSLERSTSLTVCLETLFLRLQLL
jgi:DNA polymerase-3 subunit delta'